MLKRRLGFTLQDNAFTALDNLQAARDLADSFADLELDQDPQRTSVRQVNPLMNERWFRSLSYYWVVDQAEYATDLIFTQPRSTGWSLSAAVGPRRGRLLGERHPRFLGRRFHPRFDGEVVHFISRSVDGRMRESNTRMKNNWLKMYDKFGWVLRIETVINDPRKMRVRRLRTRQGRREMMWCPMNKGVINLYRYREVALASDRRYLDALAVVDDPAPAYRQVAELTEPAVVSGRSHAGFNPASPADVRL